MKPEPYRDRARWPFVSNPPDFSPFADVREPAPIGSDEHMDCYQYGNKGLPRRKVVLAPGKEDKGQGRLF